MDRDGCWWRPWRYGRVGRERRATDGAELGIRADLLTALVAEHATDDNTRIAAVLWGGQFYSWGRAPSGASRPGSQDWPPHEQTDPLPACDSTHVENQTFDLIDSDAFEHRRSGDGYLGSTRSPYRWVRRSEQRHHRRAHRRRQMRRAGIVANINSRGGQPTRQFIQIVEAPCAGQIVLRPGAPLH